MPAVPGCPFGRHAQALELEECECREFPLCRHIAGRGGSRYPRHLWVAVLARWSPRDYGDRPKGEIPPRLLEEAEGECREQRLALYEGMAERMEEMPCLSDGTSRAERRACR